MNKKCKCGKFMKFCNREIFNNLKDYSNGIHYEGWYVCDKCGYKEKQKGEEK